MIYKHGNYVRITKGIYEGDIDYVVKTKKRVAFIAVVPRVNTESIMSKMRKESSKNPVPDSLN